MSRLLILSILISLTLRILLISHPYSGHSSPHTLFGDFEAQRHWKEITYGIGWYGSENPKWRDYLVKYFAAEEAADDDTAQSANPRATPPKAPKTASSRGIHHWYRYDLPYWGLDYPPLTAYHSYVMGYIASLIYPDMVAFETSRGIETWQTVLFMRFSVLLVDVLLFMPAIYFLCREMQRRLRVNIVASPGGDEAGKSSNSLIMPLILILSQPAFLLIDNAHFQYNNFSIGLTLWAVYACARNHMLIGACLFTLALNYKIIALYYSLPFFFFMLGRSFMGGKRISIVTQARLGLTRVAQIGLVVGATFLLCWAPFLAQGEWKQVLRRVFPFERGLFEDYVANFWCTIQPVLKFISRRVFHGQPIPHMALISAALTLLLSLPSNLMVLRKPTIQQFIFSLSSTSLVFFLTSFHVHEKTILFPLMVISFLLFYREGKLNRTVVYFSYLAAYSMYPLMVKDALQIAYWSLMLLFGAMYLWPALASVQFWKRRTLFVVLLAVSIFIQFLISFVPPPSALPYLYIYALTSFSSCGFVLCWMRIVKEQWVDYGVREKEHQE